MNAKEYKEFDEYVKYLDDVEENFNTKLWTRFVELNKHDTTTPAKEMRVKYKAFKKAELLKFASKNKKEKTK